MKERMNKPRVFLSHSKKNSQFIQRLCDDLRRCQVEPWLDEYEIRHGQPWLDAIFEDGMPTCDAVITYITDHSITSPVVRKEIDVGILQKLKDSHIAFLPYIELSALRSELRADLQTLQTPEWNTDNYSDILPRAVAEIWRSFLERTVAVAVQKERLARLEAELRLSELEKKQTGSIFQQGEVRDFEYIWEKLNRYEPFTFRHTQRKGDSQREIRKYVFQVCIVSLLPGLSEDCEFSDFSVAKLVRTALASEMPNESKLPEGEDIDLASCPDIRDELRMYGLLTRFLKPFNTRVWDTSSNVYRVQEERAYVLRYTEKLERFRYWLAVEGKMPHEIQLKTEQKS